MFKSLHSQTRVIEVPTYLYLCQAVYKIVLTSSSITRIYELYEDLGKRIGLRKKVSSKNWNELITKTYPDTPIRDASGRRLHY